METNGKILMSMDDMVKLSTQIYNSALFPGMKSEAAVFTLMMICQSEGLHPIQALKRYDIIEGKPGLKSAAIQADFQKDGGKITWHCRDAKNCQATYSQEGFGEITITTSMAEILQRGICKDKNGKIKTVWARYPRQMLHARNVTEGVRALNPGIVVGIHSVEEIQDICDEQSGNIPPTIEVDSEVIGENPNGEKPETTTEEKQSKALRAAINKEYSGCMLPDDIKKINTKYERIHGRGLWDRLTCHNQTEIFSEIAVCHINRTKSYEARHTPESHLQWALEVNDSSNEKDFLSLLFVYQKDVGYHNDAAIHESLRDRAKELGLWNDDNQDFIIDSSAE